MTGTEQETLDIIGQNEGRLHYHFIAQGLKIGDHYAYVICEGLQRNGNVTFDTFRGICSLTEKGREVVEKKWLLDLEREKEDIRKSKEESKRRILENAETINY
ncbi:MAG: hypothetical protein H8E73_10685 [Planctomycetes bacterium]|nr:hypothetical protein [Planctomycetota bacterium]MBL7184825.1 hypothetical protein [Phycisphaerae bacterium]